MTSRRLLKAAEAIREVVAQAILTEMRDPRVKDVTVVDVTVSPDMREAKITVSVMGDDKQQTLSLRGLQNAAGFLQSKIASRIETRYTPKLQFKLDMGQENVMRVDEILAKIQHEKEAEASNLGEHQPTSDGESPAEVTTDGDQTTDLLDSVANDQPTTEVPTNRSAD